MSARPKAPTGTTATLETSRSAIEERLDTNLENVFPSDEGAAPERTAAPESPAYSEWAGAKSGREDGDYNLEAFVESETTLVGHLNEQLAVAIADPKRRLIGDYLIDTVDETGYLGTDLSEVSEKLGAPLAEVEAVLAVLQTFSPTGVCARNSARMPHHPAQGTRSVRSRHAGAGRAP